MAKKARREKLKQDISGLLPEATRLSLEGPLHKAIDLLTKILELDPTQVMASSLLGDVYARLGRYDAALKVLRAGLEQGDSARANVEGLRIQLAELEQAKADLDRVNRSRFDEQRFLAKAIVPDGEGGYFVDTLGFPGCWDLEILTGREVENGADLRLKKSLAQVLQEVKSGEARLRWAGPLDRLQVGGEISVVDRVNSADGIILELVRCGDNYRFNASVSHDFLHVPRGKQRDTIGKILKEGKYLLGEAKERDIAGEIPLLPPDTLLISLGLASDYAVDILRDNLMHQGVRAVTSYIRSLKYLDAYIKDYERLAEFDGNPPDVIIVSVLDAVIEDANNLIAKLRQTFPDAFIVIGGPSSQTPEQLAVLVPDFDVLIKGDGDEAVPKLGLILGKTKRSDGLNERQIAEVKKWPGGILLRTERRRIANNIHWTNAPSVYHLPRPEKRKTIYYWQTSRGCPYDCRFCNSWSGKRYRLVTPWDNDDPHLSLPKRSAKAMKDWLVERLALEFNGELSAQELEEKLEAFQSEGKVLEIPTLKDKIFVVIEDDDFLIDRERIGEFSSEVTRLGLQHYFWFTAISSVRTVYRGGNEIDKELIGWLKQCNFKSLDLGADGLCQEVIDENQKGYTLDRHVIPLNKYLKEQGFFAFNNTIFTTPYTILPELIESLVYFTVLPYAYNTAIEIGIMGHIGTKYNNEDVINQRFEWQELTGDDMGHYVIVDNYRVPREFREYALNASPHIISYADPVVKEAAVQLAKQQPWKLFETGFSSDEVWEVVEKWRNLPADRPEMKALGDSIAFHQEKEGTDFLYIIHKIKDNMRMMDISSFVDYYQRLIGGEVEREPSCRWITEHRWEATLHRQKNDIDGAIAQLKPVVEKKPWYARAYIELIGLLLYRGKCAQAMEYFTRYQLVEPDIYTYFGFFDQFLKAINLREIHRGNRILFHLPRYYTVSPIYYFIAAIRELAGGEEITHYGFPRVRPRDMENLYDVMDRLTVDTIKGALDNAPFDIGEELRSGRVVNFFGIPVWLEDEGKRLTFGYDRISPQAPVEIARGSAKEGSNGEEATLEQATEGHSPGNGS